MDIDMTEEKRLCKIERASFGHGGYQDACIGLNITLAGSGWGVGDSKTAWDAEMIKTSEYTKWNEVDRDKQYAEIVRYISGLLKDAKVDCVSRLVGKPVEAIFEGDVLKSWRILTEVL